MRLCTTKPVRLVVLIGGLGILTNVLVAWSCAAWSPISRHVEPLAPGGGGYPEANVGPNGQRGWWHFSYGFGWQEACPHVACGAEGEFTDWGGPVVPAFRYAGWPWLSLGSTVDAVHAESGGYVFGWGLPLGEIVSRGLPTSSLPLFLHAFPDRRLPLAPMWPGFLLNAVLYSLPFALVCWLVIPGSGSSPRKASMADGSQG